MPLNPLLNHHTGQTHANELTAACVSSSGETLVFGEFILIFCLYVWAISMTRGFFVHHRHDGGGKRHHTALGAEVFVSVNVHKEADLAPATAGVQQLLAGAKLIELDVHVYRHITTTCDALKGATVGLPQIDTPGR